MSRIGNQFRLILQRMVLVGTSAILVAAASPMYAMADDPAPDTDTSTTQTTTDPSSSDPGTATDTTTSDPSSSDPSTLSTDTTTTDPPANKCPVVNGTNAPTGSSSGTYKLNTSTCLWENDYYTWDPVTKMYTPKYAIVYTYNPATGKWDSGVWDYYAALNGYQFDPFSVSAPPAGAKTIGGPSSLTISNGGAGSNNNLSGNNTNNITLNNNNKFGLTTTLTGIALSGDVGLAGNTLAGGALSGDANSTANIVNMLQSTSGLGTATTFVANINGDVQGDLLIDPSALQPASNTESLNTTNNINVNDHTDGTITNNITLNATSGDATADANTTAGDVSTGNATAMANVINLINSMISANQSFVGIININGNLNGNILMPAQFLDALIASGAPNATVSIDQNDVMNANLSNTTNQNINNNIRTNATSGDVTLDSNTTSGNAKTGSASTNVTIFDLTGNDIDASNTMLVFVNVLGTWVGLLMNAPAGTTAAAYGGHITKNTTNNINVNSTTNETINNNIDVSAQSGDASATRNTNVGNVTTGNAKAGVNLANLMNDHFNLSGWFGVLFINVFGNWNGSFGVANPLAMPGAGVGPSSSASNTDPSGAPQVFQFHSPFAASANSSAAGTSNTSSPSVSLTKKVLGEAVIKPKAVLKAAPTVVSHITQTVVAGLIIAIGLSLLGYERYLTFKSK